MSTIRSQQDQMRALCGQIQPDDGVDPREYFKPSSTGSRRDHKTLQLCRQVAQTLSFVLPGDHGDDLLERLHVVNVQPAPNAAQLSVTLYADFPENEYDPDQILERIEQETPRLRCEVAAAITRRKTPRLVFQLLRKPTWHQNE